MNTKRPVHLNLLTMRFPSTAVASILHRISGVVLFLFFPVLLYWLHLSLKDNESFIDLTRLFQQPLVKITLWLIASALLYHLLAGIRHLSMDVGLGESLQSGRQTACAVIVMSIIGSIGLGIWLW